MNTNTPSSSSSSSSPLRKRVRYSHEPLEADRDDRLSKSESPSIETKEREGASSSKFTSNTSSHNLESEPFEQHEQAKERPAPALVVSSATINNQETSTLSKPIRNPYATDSSPLQSSSTYSNSQRNNNNSSSSNSSNHTSNNNNNTKDEKKKSIVEKISSQTKHGLSDQQKECLYQINEVLVSSSSTTSLTTNHTTEQQQESKITRVTAAAGTGKTFTLMKLAQCAHLLGHEQITYLTFNKAAAEDVKNCCSISKTTSYYNVDARTIHSCAMKQMNQYRKQHNIKQPSKFVFHKMNQVIEKLYKEEIDTFLKRCYDNIETIQQTYTSSSSSSSKKKRKDPDSCKVSIRNKVIYFLEKTLNHFCTSNMTYKQFGDKNTSNRTYYPVKLYHQKQQTNNIGKKDHSGGTSSNNEFSNYFEGYNLQSTIQWYADSIYKIWPILESEGYKSYNLEMKRAQLLQLEIPGTIILSDESQDCDGCQMDWISQQAKRKQQPGKQVFFVGDAAQTIYSFRGAKSSYMINLKDISESNKVAKCILTKSWRFGNQIAKIANYVLFAKEHSSQTIGAKTVSWEPYRVIGNPNVDDCVTSKEILHEWKKAPVTLIAWKNSTLYVEAVILLKRYYAKYENEENSSKSEIIKTTSSSCQCPKLHINTAGNSSGKNKMKQIGNQAQELANLYLLSSNVTKEEFDRDCILNKDIFPEFHGCSITWTEFLKQVEVDELDKYVACIDIVTEFKARTTQALEIFNKHVLEANWSADKADVVLTTAHTAKGMEWNRVQLCDDFSFKMKIDDTNKSPRRFDTNPKQRDEINLLYVACTRAKKELSIPESMQKFLKDCDTLYELVKNDFKNFENLDESCFEVTSEDSAMEIWNELVKKLRDEHNLNENEYFLDSCR